MVTQNLLKYSLLLNVVSSTRRGMAKRPRTREPSGVTLTNVTTTDTKRKLCVIQHLLWKQVLSLASSESSALRYGSGAGEGCAPALPSKAMSASSHSEGNLTAAPHCCPHWGALSGPHCYVPDAALPPLQRAPEVPLTTPCQLAFKAWPLCTVII